jgi:hypothetical protein
MLARSLGPVQQAVEPLATVLACLALPAQRIIDGLIDVGLVHC